MSGVCNKTSNNKYFDCPALAYSNFTDWRPSCYVNDMIRQQNGIQSSYEYAQWLQHNANNVMRTNSAYTQDKMGCRPCKQMGPNAQSVCTYNRINRSCVPSDCDGLGVVNQATSNTSVDSYDPGLQEYVTVNNFPGSGN